MDRQGRLLLPAYLRSSSQRGLRATSDLRVAVLSASGWMRGAALATAGLPTTTSAGPPARGSRSAPAWRP